MAKLPTSCTAMERSARPRCGASTRSARACPGNGFTLLELVIAMAVLAVLVSMGAPSFRALIDDAGLARASVVLDGALRLGRSEAIKRGRSVEVCARASDTACGTAWSGGFLVYADHPDDGTQGVLDAEDDVLRIGPPLRTGLDASARAIVRPNAMADKGAVRFSPRGRADWTLGTVVLCDARGAAHARALLVNGAGTVRRERGDGTTAGIAKDAAGAPVSCPSATVGDLDA